MTRPGSALISVAELRESLGSVVVLDASIRRGTGTEPPFASGLADYREAHLPGAHFADLFGGFSDDESDLPFMRPRPARLAATAAALGITDNTEVVVYDRLTGAWAARIWWLLRSYGFPTVRVLNGGLTAWRAAGLPVIGGDDDAVPAHRPPTLIDHSEQVAALDEVAALSRNRDRLLVCGLRREEFAGDPADPRSGHIPGTVSLPFAETLDDRGLISPDHTRTLAAAIGLEPASRRPVLYCGGAINAAGVALALHEIGISEVAVYDGSLTEWRLDESRPLEQLPKES